MHQDDDPYMGFSNCRLRFNGVSLLSRALGTELHFLELSATAPLKAEEFGIVEVALFRVMPDGRGMAHSTLVNPECEFDEMTSRALGLSTKDVINFAPWGASLSPFFDKGFADGACLISIDSTQWAIPALLRAQAQAGRAAPDSLYSADIRKLIRGLLPSTDSTGTVMHLAQQFGVGPYRGIQPCVASVFAQVEIIDALINHCGVEAVADAMAGVTA